MVGDSSRPIIVLGALGPPHLFLNRARFRVNPALSFVYDFLLVAVTSTSAAAESTMSPTTVTSDVTTNVSTQTTQGRSITFYIRILLIIVREYVFTFSKSKKRDFLRFLK